MGRFKRTQAKYVKRGYRVRNWPRYEAGLRSRGSLTVWLDVDAMTGELANWNAPKRTNRKPGRPRTYSNHAIETAVTLGLVFHLPSRQTEGFLKSLFALLTLQAAVPDHTTISRRRACLGAVALGGSEGRGPVHILIDSSGLKVHVGQMRRPPKNRDYRKLHIAVDEQTGDVLACNLTRKSAHDSTRVGSLLSQINRPLASMRADAAYDANAVYQAVDNHHRERSPRVLIPPQRGALLSPTSASTRERNRNIRSRLRIGKRAWHTKSGYSLRAKVETTFSRYKGILGPAMRARRLVSQRVEARIGCKILNQMTALGMPHSEMIG